MDTSRYITCINNWFDPEVNELKKSISVFSAVIVLFLILHSTPGMALRTHVILKGYPIAAITSGIIEDDFHNEVDKEKFKRLNAKAYTLTSPPIEAATEGELRNFLVRKIGFLHFAEYYGEG